MTETHLFWFFIIITTVMILAVTTLAILSAIEVFCDLLKSWHGDGDVNE